MIASRRPKAPSAKIDLRILALASLATGISLGPLLSTPLLVGRLDGGLLSLHGITLAALSFSRRDAGTRLSLGPLLAVLALGLSLILLVANAALPNKFLSPHLSPGACAAAAATLTICISLLIWRQDDRFASPKASPGDEMARWSEVAEQAPSAIYVKDGDGRYLLVNRHIEARMGKSRGELLGATDYDLFPKEVADALRANDSRVFLGGGPLVTEERIPRPDGERIYYSVKFPLGRNSEGHPTALAGISSDITGQRTKEERRGFLLDLQTDLARLSNPQVLAQTAIAKLGEKLAVAGAGLALVNLASQEITVLPGYGYKSPPLGLTRFPLAVFGQALAEARGGETIVIEDTERDPRTSGKYKELHERFGVRGSVMVPLFRDGEWVAFVGIYTQGPRAWAHEDVQLVKEVAELAWPLYENARLRDLAEEAVRARDEFLSIASHELKTPLTPLSIRLQALQRELELQPESPLTTAVRNHLESGKKQIQRLADLVSNLLDVSRIRAGRFNIEYGPVDFSKVVADVAHRFEMEASRAQSELILHLPPSLPGISDALRLEQIVDNLISNALKYGGGGPITLDLNSSEGTAHLVISDQGIGIAQEAQKRIFDPFERAVGEHKYGGLGLGLHIVRGILENLGGAIEVESELGKGARFSVRIPLAPNTAFAGSPLFVGTDAGIKPRS